MFLKLAQKRSTTINILIIKKRQQIGLFIYNFTSILIIHFSFL